MSLIVRVYLNERQIAAAGARNLSGGASVSDYEVETVTVPYPPTGEPSVTARGRIYGHDREQCAWALVEKMAQIAQVREPGSGEREGAA